MKRISFLLCTVILAGFVSCRKDAAPNPGTGRSSEKTDQIDIAEKLTSGKHTLEFSSPNRGSGQQDCLVNSIFPTSNLSSNPDLAASAWTYQGTFGIARDFFKFPGISYLPAGTTINAATLYFYGLAPGTAVANNTGNSFYPGSPYNPFGDNAGWVKRVTGPWEENTITWSNQPGTTSLNQAGVAASTSQWDYNTTVNVTALVQDIVNSGQNYGFSLQQQVESYYRNLNFAGHRHSDPARWPKLTITFTIP
ncbi:DNRLRE domain-containing protein [Chitinophaga nivalis]|uniref:DNRLRE domain-containing protein n=1 Tax=Chitinophaga nivalis TaxID=2991709 RepID=A0ABT3IHI1_9BACT|nr:DNRLRE domain-containing protein [Chitinophaga nivalis]MCW3466901.1 DNRLRE domain-containing protein [Chitinophaga nivalis]MCW3483408.1 DNRLRE domain-containing protein [Chitinophaga nivalis]